MGRSYRKFIFLGISIFLFIFFVFHATAASTIHTQTLPLENGAVMSDTEPIHIGSGFTLPISPEKPTRILIPSISINIPIVDAAIIDGHWEVSETFANHGIGSAYPGQKGNMVIFAHAREGLFLNLQHILQGEEVYVLTNKKWYAYTVDEITQVTPEQVEVIAPTTDERITLFTCSGFADEKRLIVVGKKKEVTFGLDETFTNLLE